MPRRAPRLDPLLGKLRHELRNAQGPIAMIVDMLALRDGTPELAMLARELRTLALMIDDMSSITTTTYADVSLAPRSVELAGVVGRAVELTAPYLSDRGAGIAVAVPAGLRVVVDPTFLALALSSLLRHVATPAHRLVIEAVPVDATRTVAVRVRTGGAPLPNQRALVFASKLVELQGGALSFEGDLELTLPSPPHRVVSRGGSQTHQADEAPQGRGAREETRVARKASREAKAGTGATARRRASVSGGGGRRRRRGSELSDRRHRRVGRRPRGARGVSPSRSRA